MGEREMTNYRQKKSPFSFERTGAVCGSQAMWRSREMNTFRHTGAYEYYPVADRV
jgi:hypothetical protein